MVKRDEEFAEMYTQCWRAHSMAFYDAKHHGTNWEAVRAKYRPVVAHVTMKEDLYSLISLMLGELNASHLGISGRLPYPDEATADLGLIFDESIADPGSRLPKSSSAARRTSAVWRFKAGRCDRGHRSRRTDRESERLPAPQQ